MMHKALHQSDDIDRLYVLRKGLTSIEDSIKASIWELEEYIKKSKERLITAANNSTDNIRTNRTTTKTRKQKWEEKQLYGYFKWRTGKTLNEKT